MRFLKLSSLLTGVALASCPARAGWFQQASGVTNDLKSVQFPVNAQTGYAVGDSGIILKTTNGGAVWGGLSSGTVVDLRSACFRSAQTGWAVGGAGTILKTTDGGANWVPQASTTTDLLMAVDFTDALTGFIVGWNGSMERTTDGGANWTSLTGSSYFLSAVYFPYGNQTGYRVSPWSGWGVIERTTDGGANWAIQRSGGTALWSVHAPGSSGLPVAYAVGSSGTVLRTTDGGANWVPQTSGTSNTLFSVHCPLPADIDRAYAVGDSGTILRTTDGGASWTGQISGTLNPLYSVHFAATYDTGYAVGGRGIILKTTDGGVGVEEDAGLRGPQPEGGFRVTPNPFASLAVAKGHERETFALYDLAGRRVALCRGDRVADGLGPGVYFLRSLEGGGKPLRIVKLR